MANEDKLLIGDHSNSIWMSHSPFFAKMNRKRKRLCQQGIPFKPIKRGLLACLPATLLTALFFSVKGLFFPSGPYP